MDPQVQKQMLKLMSVRLCPPVPGQALMDMIVSPPAPSDPSFVQFQKVREMRLRASGDPVGEGTEGYCGPILP